MTELKTQNGGNEMEKNTKRIIDDCLEKIIATVRMDVETRGVTRDEAMAYVADRGNEITDRIFGMTEEAFAIYLMEILMRQLGVKKRGGDDD